MQKVRLKQMLASKNSFKVIDLLNIFRGLLTLLILEILSRTRLTKAIYFSIIIFKFCL